jgi:hypothetical protein
MDCRCVRHLAASISCWNRLTLLVVFEVTPSPITQAVPTCDRPDFAARSLWSPEVTPPARDRRGQQLGPAPKSRVRLRASRAASQPAPNPSTIVSLVLAKGFSKARFLEGNHGPVHGGPRQDHQDQRPGFAHRERYARTDDRERQGTSDCATRRARPSHKMRRLPGRIEDRAPSTKHPAEAPAG